MALDPYEVRRRRREKAQQRAKERARRRQMLIRGGIAVAVLVLCVLILLAIANAVEKKKQKQAAAESAAKITTVRLAMVGDLNINHNIVGGEDGTADFNAMFADVAHLLADADLTVANFEGVLGGAPYGDSKTAPQALMQTLDSYGVDLIQLANSYSIHKGVSGLAKTIDGVRSAGMEPLGVYKNRQDYEESGGFTLCEIQGVRIAFVAFTKGMDGMALPDGSENCVNVLYTDYASTYQQLDEEGVVRVLEAAEAEKPDITVALLHWGSEYNNTLSSSQKQIRNLLRNNGVDAIIGTHSHYVQEMDHDAEDKSFVAYSLGDFVSDDLRAGSEYSVVLELEITKNNVTGETVVANFGYTPVFTVAEEGKPVRVMRIRETMAAYEAGYIDRVTKETYDAMAYALERIEARVAGE